MRNSTGVSPNLIPGWVTICWPSVSLARSVALERNFVVFPFQSLKPLPESCLLRVFGDCFEEEAVVVQSVLSLVCPLPLFLVPVCGGFLVGVVVDLGLIPGSQKGKDFYFWNKFLK